MADENCTRVYSVAEFLEQLAGLKLGEGRMRFFRGHADFRRYKIRPSIYRHRSLIANEPNLIQEAIIRCPGDFPDSCTWFDKLVKVQHYGLPTRLLDVTTNALAALFFACRAKEKTDGEVIVFDIPKWNVKYYNSDTVALIANLARRPISFDISKLPIEKKRFYRHTEVRRLLHDIREDKPAFRPLIIREDLSRVICVRAKLDNARIAKQDGAFLLFGIRSDKRKCAQIANDWIIRGEGAKKRIIFSSKQRMKKELEQIGISEQTLFPELDYQTKSIVIRFTKKNKRKAKS